MQKIKVKKERALYPIFTGNTAEKERGNERERETRLYTKWLIIYDADAVMPLAD